MQIIEPKPSTTRSVSLTAISDRQLLLQGNFIDDNKEIVREWWIFDTLSASWRKHTTALKEKRPRYCHTATASINNNVIIIGGYGPPPKSPNPLETLHVMLEPKSLQQLAGKTISKHKAVLPWEEALPRSLCNLLGFL